MRKNPILENIPSDTENKRLWYKAADEWEVIFCKEVAPSYGMRARINKDKSADPTAPDLELLHRDRLWYPAELKPQFTPFFTAGKLYGISPRYAFALNVSDVREYKERGWGKYIVIFWIDWQKTSWGGIEIEYLSNLWWGYMSEIFEWVEKSDPPVHQYKRRVGDRNNASESYIFDIREFSSLGEHYRELDKTISPNIVCR